MRILITPVAKEIVRHFFKKLHLFIGMILLVAGPQVILAQWSTNTAINTPICVLPGAQEEQDIVSDGAGGAIIVWYERRSSTSYDINAQRVDTNGVIQWANNGVVVCNVSSDGVRPPRATLVPDGEGGAIITWHDQRNGTDYDIYAQKINASGIAQWTNNGVSICIKPGDQLYPIIISDGSGGAIITWRTFADPPDPRDLFAQRISAAGIVQWTTNGVAVCTAIDGQDEPVLVPDGAGGAILAWNDSRSGGNDIYAQRINASGSTQWTSNGVAICTLSGNQFTPRIETDGLGGAIITWDDTRGIYAQRINSNGIVQWTTNGKAIHNGGIQPTIATDGSGGVIITWFSGDVIYAQRISDSGNLLWATNGIVVCPMNLTRQQMPKVKSDKAGGGIIAWDDLRGDDWNVYAQHVNSNGIPQWAATGVPICTATANQFILNFIVDNSGGAIATWLDFREGDSDINIYCQKFYSDGGPPVDPPKPDMRITYRGFLNIPDGDTTPSVTYGTDYGDVFVDSFLVREFFIVNPSDANLVIIETTLIGPDSSSYLHGIVYGAVTIPPHDSTQLNVMFSPSFPGAPGTPGVKSATVSIKTNVAGKNPYTFAIRGNATNRCGMKRFYWDGDKDGYGNAPEWLDRDACVAPNGFVENALDCDDTNPAVHPGAAESCNGKDDDCDGQIDEGFTQNTYYRDADVDGYGNPAITIKACVAPSGYVANNQDCNDANSDAHPGATEVCNGKDDDCDGQIDEGNVLYRDADGDGYGNLAVTTVSCTTLAGYVTNKTDCNDASASVHPGAVETANGIDDNCNGQIDEGTLFTYYRDADGDGYGNAAVTTTATTLPNGYVENKTDCNDSNAAVHPGAIEICNSIDDDCDGQIDEVVGNTSVSIGNDARSYFGYLPDQCITKTATVTNGVAPYSYFWTIDRPLLSNVVTADGDEMMTGINSPTVEVCLLDTANLCVTITDANGCTFSGCATIFAADVRCFADNSGGQKINICHEGTTICINQNDLAEHLAHGDYIGACVAGFTMYPNPSPGELKLSLSLPDNTSSGEVQIVNSYGLIVQRIAVGPQQNIINVTINQSGLYLVRLIVNKQTFTQQVTVIR